MQRALTRRELLRGLSTTSLLVAEARQPGNLWPSHFLPPSRMGPGDEEGKRWKGSALGNLYPFIKQQQQKTHQSMAYLHRQPKNLEAWKAEGRAKVFDLMSYRPEATNPRARSSSGWIEARTCASAQISGLLRTGKCPVIS
jgi:hypothetical protein